MNVARYLPRFRRAYRALPELAARERWRREDIEAWQLERLNRLWTAATRDTTYYAALKQRAHLPARFSSLAEFSACVPVLPKATVHQGRDRFLARTPARGAWRTTSGSTGIPTAVYWSDAANREALQARYRLLDEWGVDFFERSVMVWSDRLAADRGARVRVLRLERDLVDRLRNRRRLSINALSAASIESYLQVIAAFRPAHLYAFSSAAFLMARVALEREFGCDSIRAVVVTAEVLLPHMRAATRLAFNAPVIVEYGAAECGFLAGESADGTLRVREDQVLLETQERPDGRHDIIVTPFTNTAFPLIRYQLGDVSGTGLQRPARGFAVLEGLSGRSNDLLVTRSGSYVHESPVSQIFESQPGLLRYTLHQDGSGAVSGQVEMDDPGCFVDVECLERRLERLLQGCRVKLRVVDRISPLPGGKHRWIVTDLATPLDAGAESPAVVQA